MGVVSNGMLCSGDELGLTADARRHPDPARRHAARPAARRAVRRHDPRRRRQAEPGRRAVDRRARARGGGGDRRAAAPAADRRGRVGPADRRAPAGRGPATPDLCPRFVGRWVSGVRVGPSPDRIQMRLLAAGQRPVSNVVDASQLRHARARQADPHVRRGGRPRRPDRRPPRRRPGSGSRRSTTSPASSTPRRSSSPTRRARSASPASWAAPPRRSPTPRPRSIVESAIFDPISIRRTAFRYALRSEASLRFEKGQESRLARLGADRTARLIAEWAGGEVAPGRGRHEPDRAHAAHTSPSGRPGSTGCSGTNLGADEQRALLARVGIETAPAAAGARITVAARHAAARRRARIRPRRSSTRPCRPGGATWSSRRTSPRRSSGSTATSSSRRVTPHTPMPPYRPDPLGRPERASARRSSGPACPRS